MTNINKILILVIVLSIFYILFSYRENLSANIVTNVFSDLRCLADDLPIVRLIDNKTFQCITKNKNDTTNCMLRSDFKIPDTIPCNQINQYLSREGVRDKSLPTRQLFDNLEKDVDYNFITCNQDAFNDPNHWCGKLYKNVTDVKCPSTEGKFGFFVNACKNMPEYASLPISGSLTSITTRENIIDAKAEAKLISDISRNPALCGGVTPCRNELFTRNCTFRNNQNGNISIIDKRSNQIIWQSNTTNLGQGPYKLEITSNGNFVLTDKNNTTIWQSGTSGTNIDKLYKTNLLEQNNKCVLELTDKTNKILWSSPLPDIYPLPLQQAPLQTQPITATRLVVPVRR